MTRTIVITGASDGIGAELARQLATKHGAAIALVLAARNADKLNAVADAVRSVGAAATVIPTDVTDREACRQLINGTIEAHGRLDVLVQNAGMSAHANFADLTDDDLAWYQDLMTLNLWSTVWLTKDALPHLTESKGQIVAVSSVAGLVGVPGRSAYCASKWAMGGFFESLRGEVAHQGITVTIAYPGVVATAIRERGYAAGGQPLGKSGVREDKAMSVEECAARIVEGMDARKRDIIMTRQTHLGRWLRLLAPGLLDRIAMKEIKPEFRPDKA